MFTFLLEGFNRELCPLFHSLPQGNDPPKDWPSKGEIIMENMSVRYAKELAPVINDVNIKIRPGQKVSVYLVSIFQSPFSYFFLLE